MNPSSLFAFVVASFSIWSAAKADPAAELSDALSKAAFVSVDRESVCLLDAQGVLTRFTGYGGTPLHFGFNESGTKAYLFRHNIIELDRTRKSTRTISLPPKVSGIDFVVLPKTRFAILDNRDDVIHVVGSNGELLKTVRMNLAADRHIQNVAGIVVRNKLIVSEDGNRQLLAMDVHSYETSVFKKLPDLHPWLGAIAWRKDRYYVCTNVAVYTFQTPDEKPQELVRLPQGSITGLAVTTNSAYIAVNSTGEIRRIDLSKRTHEVIASGLKSPEGLSVVPQRQR